jgi:hypothetical protein
MKMLILGADQSKRHNWGHQLFKDEIARQHDVEFYGEGFPAWSFGLTDIEAIIDFFGFYPDLIFSYMGKYCKWITGLDRIPIPKVHHVIDYFPWNYSVEDDYLDANQIDLVLAPCKHEVRSLLRHGYKAKRVPFSVDIDVFRPGNEKRDFDVVAIFSVVRWAYPTRRVILERVEKMGVRGLLRASWPKTRIWHKDYVDALRQAKIVLNGVDKHKSLNWKFLEPCACGALLMTEYSDDMGSLGFKDKKNCVVFDGLDDMEEKIWYYLLHEEERQLIAARGARLVRGKHTTKVRVEEMTKVLEEIR